MRDVGSLNGTYLNRERIEEAPLHDGDELQIGKFKLVFFAGRRSSSVAATGPHLSIGEVLSLLQDEFPDVTISKIRFLESQGLLDPERTPSGYRKFYEPDIERLRWILRQQRENFLPLKVIKDRLDGAEGNVPSESEVPAQEQLDIARDPGPSDPPPVWMADHAKADRCLGRHRPRAGRGDAATSAGPIPGAPASAIAARSKAAIPAGIVARPPVPAAAPANGNHPRPGAGTRPHSLLEVRGRRCAHPDGPAPGGCRDPIRLQPTRRSRHRKGRRCQAVNRRPIDRTEVDRCRTGRRRRPARHRRLGRVDDPFRVARRRQAHRGPAHRAGVLRHRLAVPDLARCGVRRRGAAVRPSRGDVLLVGGRGPPPAHVQGGRRS